MSGKSHSYFRQRSILTACSAKELEHYQRVRKTFEGPTPGEKNTRVISSPLDDLRETRLNSTERSLPSRPKFMTRPSNKAKDKEKGKGKATRWDSENDDEDDDEDDAYVTSNDYGTPSRDQATNGSLRGKGKQVIRNYQSDDTGFRDVSKDDDDELYE